MKNKKTILSTVRSKIKKIAGYIKAIIEDELEVMDAFYAQYLYS